MPTPETILKRERERIWSRNNLKANKENNECSKYCVEFQSPTFRIYSILRSQAVETFGLSTNLECIKIQVEQSSLPTTWPWCIVSEDYKETKCIRSEFFMWSHLPSALYFDSICLELCCCPYLHVKFENQLTFELLVFKSPVLGLFNSLLLSNLNSIRILSETHMHTTVKIMEHVISWRFLVRWFNWVLFPA